LPGLKKKENCPKHNLAILLLTALLTAALLTTLAGLLVRLLLLLAGLLTATALLAALLAAFLAALATLLILLIALIRHQKLLVSGNDNASMGLNVPDSGYSCPCQGAFTPPAGVCRIARLGSTLRNAGRAPWVEPVARRVVFGVASGPGPFPQAPQPPKTGATLLPIKKQMKFAA
jgi:hypothetical protein